MTDSQELQVREKEELESAAETTRPGPVFRPDVDILERPDEYVILADLPGVDDRSVDVSLERSLLTLDARLATLPETGWSPIHSEYRLGSFHREFRISDDVDADGVSAKMHDGVLEVRLPKTAARRPRSIEVQAG
jgi:HSP20 family molecular chaperone IbpA